MVIPDDGNDSSVLWVGMTGRDIRRHCTWERIWPQQEHHVWPRQTFPIAGQCSESSLTSSRRRTLLQCSPPGLAWYCLPPLPCCQFYCLAEPSELQQLCTPQLSTVSPLWSRLLKQDQPWTSPEPWLLCYLGFWGSLEQSHRAADPHVGKAYT